MSLVPGFTIDQDVCAHPRMRARLEPPEMKRDGGLTLRFYPGEWSDVVLVKCAECDSTIWSHGRHA